MIRFRTLLTWLLNWWKPAPKVNNGGYLLTGQNVDYGEHVKLNAQGGVVIGDGVRIGENSCIGPPIVDEQRLSYEELRHRYQPILIGKGVRTSAGVTLEPGTILPAKTTVASRGRNKRPIASCPENVFFIVSTGRSGSESISRILGHANGVKCVHEGFPPVISLSTDYLHGNRSREEVLTALRLMYQDLSVLDDAVEYFGESDQKLSFLIPLLLEIFPKAKFIWLIREAAPFVASAYKRGWFDDWEFGYASERGRYYDASKRNNMIHALNRVNGSKAGALSETAWQAMTPFERNCWYWHYCNKTIERDLAGLPAEQWMQLKTQDLNCSKRLNDVLRFLDLKENHYQQLQKVPKVHNRANYRPLTPDSWTAAQRMVFEKWTDPLMRKYFFS